MPQDEKAGEADYGYRVAVGIVYRAMQIPSWLDFCRDIRALDEEAADLRRKVLRRELEDEQPHIPCWRKLAAFSDQLPQASEADLCRLLEPGELWPFLAYVTDLFESPELGRAAVAWVHELAQIPMASPPWRVP